jgi:CRISPR-associated endonuclease Csy4
MNYYLEITLLSNPDINLFSLWSKAYQQIHLGLVEMQDAQGHVPIGVSFPEYTQEKPYGILGEKLRLFAPEPKMLEAFNVDKWLSRLSDYVHYTSIRQVPANLKGHATYQRYQPKAFAQRERLARRYAKRHNMDYDSALAYYKDNRKEPSDVPFIHLTSLSGGQAFRFFIKKIPRDVAVKGNYNTYGLSTIATVPEF